MRLTKLFSQLFPIFFHPAIDFSKYIIAHNSSAIIFSITGPAKINIMIYRQPPRKTPIELDVMMPSHQRVQSSTDECTVSSGVICPCPERDPPSQIHRACAIIQKTLIILIYGPPCAASQLILKEQKKTLDLMQCLQTMLFERYSEILR